MRGFSVAVVAGALLTTMAVPAEASSGTTLTTASSGAVLAKASPGLAHPSSSLGMAHTASGSVLARAASGPGVGTRVPPGVVPVVKAKAVVLDLNGAAVWSVNANTKRPIASLTKVMTAIVVLKSGRSLDQPVTIKKKHTTYGDKWDATEARFKAGDRVKVRDLLYGTLLVSGADAAAALADTYGPGRKNFVKRMNATAKQLGLSGTKYANFDGLPYPSQWSTYSTASDQIKLAKHALAYPAFREIAMTQKAQIQTLAGRSYTFKNTNSLIGKYEGAFGVKTGFTNKAGHCLLFAAQRGDQTQIGVILGSPTGSRRFADAMKLLDWGFGVEARRLAADPLG